MLISSLTLGFRDLFRRKILAILFVPALGAILIWSLIGYFVWQPISLWASTSGVQVFFLDKIPAAVFGFMGFDAGAIAVALSSVLVVALLLPLMLLTALGITSLLATPLTLSFVQSEFYKNVQKKSDTSMARAVWVTGSAVGVYLILWFLTIPLWFVPGLNFFVTILLNSYLNYKIFSFETLSPYASKVEIRQILKENRDGYLALSIVSSLFLFPPFFLIAPVYTGLIFSRYGLAKLQLVRERGQSQPT